MNGAILAILIIGGIAVLGVVVYLGWLAEKKRREAMAVFAERIGWRFDPARDRRHDDEYAHFEIFRRGHSRAAYNTLSGEVDLGGRSCPVKMGDFIYKITRHTGKSTTTTTYRFSYIILHLPFGGVPDLLIRREGLWDKLTDAFGFDDIDFESVEFSRRFHVASPDKKFAYAVIHPRMMEFMLSSDAAAVDIERERCCLSDGRKRWKPEQFEHKLDWVRQFFELWPEHVMDRLEA